MKAFKKRNFNRSCKEFLFRNNFVVALALLTLFVVCVLINIEKITAYKEFVAAVGGGLVAFLYFLQQQSVIENQHFVNLFEKFNQRYDKLNDELQSILKSQASHLTEDEAKTLVDYFNLTAEEFLMYQEGYINGLVWESWEKGFLDYLKNRKIQELWAEESKSESYYNLEKVLR